jgi:hypothetical protein
VSMQDTRTIFAPNVLEARKSFWTHMMELLGGEAQVEACFGEIVLILTQDRCTFCTNIP